MFNINKIYPYILILSWLSFIFFYLRHNPAVRVGDGSEYYALFLAWSETFRPWMSSVSFEAYDKLIQQKEIIGLISAEKLQNVFPDLKIGDTYDFNHFWFYSLLAYLCYKLLLVLGINVGINDGFLLLHFFLTAIASIISFYFYRWRGITAFYLIAFASPVLWYFDKVHTELFTFCLSVIAMLFFMKDKYLASALAFAVASTQNPSFSLVAVIALLFRITKYYQNRFNILELLLLVSVIIMTALHPSYYFFRYRVVTPQLKLGAAALGTNLSSFYIWILDPDIGLFPNWPVGLILVCASLFVYFSKERRRLSHINYYLLIYVLLFLGINFYAHSSTLNLNSGGTLGIARYALWYLPAFYPVILYIVSQFSGKKIRLFLGSMVLLLSTIISLILYNPNKSENYAIPSDISLLIQTYASSLYNPPIEVFAERFSGLGEDLYSLNPRGILGPDCRKLLIYTGDDKTEVISPSKCFIDKQKLEMFVASLNFSDKKEPFYLKIDELSFEMITISLKPGVYYIGAKKEGNIILKSGWSSPEPWGVWSDDTMSILSYPCNKKQFYFNREKVEVKLSVAPYGKQAIYITNDQDKVYEGLITEPSIIIFGGNVSRCIKDVIEFHIHISDPMSPAAMGQSDDNRKLGISLTKFEIE